MKNQLVFLVGVGGLHHKGDLSFRVFVSSISLSVIWWFSIYRSFTYFVKPISKSFKLLAVIASDYGYCK